MTRLRASTIQTFATVQTVLRPQAALAPTITTAVDPQEQSSGRWPRSTQAYCIYTRKPSGGGEELSGVITFGLSTPVFHFSIGTRVYYFSLFSLYLLTLCL